MCGIMGLVKGSKTTEREARAIQALLIANETRGDHSTGIYSKGKIYKTVDSSTLFVQDTRVRPLLIGSNLILGHTRFATKGAITRENAHPYKFGRVVGIHNGVLSDYGEVYPNAAVDSMAIFYGLGHSNNDYGATFKKLKGSMACAWEYGGKLYLLAHDNPIAVAHIDDCIFFSSEIYPLVSILYGIYGKMPDATYLESDKVVIISNDMSMEHHKVTFKSVFQTHYFPRHAHKGGKIGTSTNEEIQPIYDVSSEIIRAPKTNVELFEQLMELGGCANCGQDHAAGYLDQKNFMAFCEGCVIKDQVKHLEHIREGRVIYL